VEFATEAIDRLHTTAEAHHRVIVVEVMGRNAGWIALYSGVAGGADVILIPEIPFALDRVAERIRERDRWGARFSIVVAAEGARPVGGEVSMIESDPRPGNPRLGGIGKKVAIALEPLVGKETRHVVLGHLQRGGAPNSYDRMLATRFGAAAMRLVEANVFGKMVAFKPPDIVPVPLAAVVGGIKNVPLDSDILQTARALGISLGE
jgi:6-phosphofructokinase 1